MEQGVEVGPTLALVWPDARNDDFIVDEVAGLEVGRRLQQRCDEVAPALCQVDGHGALLDAHLHTTTPGQERECDRSGARLGTQMVPGGLSRGGVARENTKRKASSLDQVAHPSGTNIALFKELAGDLHILDIGLDRNESVSRTQRDRAFREGIGPEIVAGSPPDREALLGHGVDTAANHLHEPSRSVFFFGLGDDRKLELPDAKRDSFGNGDRRVDRLAIDQARSGAEWHHSGLARFEMDQHLVTTDLGLGHDDVAVRRTPDQQAARADLASRSRWILKPPSHGVHPLESTPLWGGTLHTELPLWTDLDERSGARLKGLQRGRYLTIPARRGGPSSGLAVPHSRESVSRTVAQDLAAGRLQQFVEARGARCDIYSQGSPGSCVIHSSMRVTPKSSAKRLGNSGILISGSSLAIRNGRKLCCGSPGQRM